MIKLPLTLEYWQDDGWYIGKLKEIPGVFSQGQDLAELEANIADAYQSLIDSNNQTNDSTDHRSKAILLEIG